MHAIDQPEILDPDRMLGNTRGGFTTHEGSREELLEAALHDSCNYAKILWDQLGEVREFLIAMLPPDPRAPGGDVHLGASPTGPDDEKGWQRWVATYGAVTSALCGPHGDSGYGLGIARREAELRRDAPNLRVLAKLDSETRSSQQPQAGAESASESGKPAAPPDDHPHSAMTVAKAVAGVVVAMLALRGLRPRGSR